MLKTVRTNRMEHQKHPILGILGILGKAQKQKSASMGCPTVAVATCATPTTRCGEKDGTSEHHARSVQADGGSRRDRGGHRGRAGFHPALSVARCPRTRTGGA